MQSDFKKANPPAESKLRTREAVLRDYFKLAIPEAFPRHSTSSRLRRFWVQGSRRESVGPLRADDSKPDELLHLSSGPLPIFFTPWLSSISSGAGGTRAPLLCHNLLLACCRLRISVDKGGLTFCKISLTMSIGALTIRGRGSDCVAGYGHRLA